jgi:hypothetical protein
MYPLLCPRAKPSTYAADKAIVQTCHVSAQAQIVRRLRAFADLARKNHIAFPDTLYPLGSGLVCNNW